LRPDLSQPIQGMIMAKTAAAVHILVKEEKLAATGVTNWAIHSSPCR
jgi:hypothetical protein